MKNDINISNIKTYMDDIGRLILNLKVHNFNQRWDTVRSLRCDIKLLRSGLCKDPCTLLIRCREFIDDISTWIATNSVSLYDPIVSAVREAESAASEHKFLTATSQVVNMLYDYGRSVDP